jgi:hypothetical protein
MAEFGGKRTKKMTWKQSSATCSLDSARTPVALLYLIPQRAWSQDGSVDITAELCQRCDLQLRDVPFFLQDFVDRYEGRYHDNQLPLPMRLV